MTKLNPFFRCDCGKLHIMPNWLTHSVCECGKSLPEQWAAKTNIINNK